MFEKFYHSRGLLKMPVPKQPEQESSDTEKEVETNPSSLPPVLTERDLE